MEIILILFAFVPIAAPLCLPILFVVRAILGSFADAQKQSDEANKAWAQQHSPEEIERNLKEKDRRWEEFGRQYRKKYESQQRDNSHKEEKCNTPPRSNLSMKQQKAMRIFCLSVGCDLLTSIEQAKEEYKKAAKKHHPDHGGRPEDFMLIRECFEDLQSCFPK